MLNKCHDMRKPAACRRLLFNRQSLILITKSSVKPRKVITKQALQKELFASILKEGNLDL